MMGLTRVLQALAQRPTLTKLEPLSQSDTYAGRDTPTWPHALARVAPRPDYIFEVLHSKPTLVPSEDTSGGEMAEEPGVPKKRKYYDE
jgi:hypothetical protein